MNDKDIINTHCKGSVPARNIYHICRYVCLLRLYHTTLLQWVFNVEKGLGDSFLFIYYYVCMITDLQIVKSKLNAHLYPERMVFS